MFDLKWIRDNPESYERGLARRGLTGAAAELLALDRQWREAQTEAEQLQAERNRLAKEIGAAKAQGRDAADMLRRVAESKDRQAALEARAGALKLELDRLLAALPNLPADDVPDGFDETHNKLVRQHGTPPAFAFPVKDHAAIGEALGMMDFETAGRLSGARFVVLSGALARLERALAQFMLDLHTRDYGYREVSPPLLVRDETMFGTGQLPKFAEDQFKTTQGLWLIPTAEVPLTNLFGEQILDEATLPARVTAWTPCFRAEAGAAGKDTRGMIRQHQFSKVELVSIAHPDRSEAEHERMTACAEEVLKRLGLALSRHAALRRRYGLLGAQDLRHRSLAAGAERLSRDFELLRLRRLPGAPDEGALPAEGREGDALRPHAQRLRPCRRAHAHRGAGELPAGQWQCRRARRAQALYERAGSDRRCLKGRSISPPRASS